MIHPMTYPRLLLSAFCMLLTISASQATAVPAHTVRFVYLVSSDRTVNPAYTEAIEQAAREMQAWMAGQLGGRTFALHAPVVTIVQSEQTAMWFTQHPNGSDKASYGFRNTLDEMRKQPDFKLRRDGYIWVIYSDGPGDSGRAFPGFAYLPEDDLLGLVGKHPSQKNPKRWVAGMGHELGHALGLPHPQDTETYYQALMWAGFYNPDKAYLTTADKKILLANTYLELTDQPTDGDKVGNTKVAE